MSVRLRGTTGNRDAIGARVTLVTGGRTQTQQRMTASGYLSQGTPLLHFGLGAATSATVHVSWLDGSRQTLEVRETDRVMDVVQGANEELHR